MRHDVARSSPIVDQIIPNANPGGCHDGRTRSFITLFSIAVLASGLAALTKANVRLLTARNAKLIHARAGFTYVPTFPPNAASGVAFMTTSKPFKAATSRANCKTVAPTYLASSAASKSNEMEAPRE
eukprot:CAMPEP_0119190746 /NCGR_PEP_ID=MMETSP1316-20130426/1749_1 /TAXON_ID=41880 /ORGANISM="Pycnococcus provasolii, Strain RCC2336" /LENGTH=126 /DNA_ID=CAMNT_0007185673 /DNA_START=303 /DNA_END=686 /DNA_ORIENTATION=-